MTEPDIRQCSDGDYVELTAEAAMWNYALCADPYHRNDIPIARVMVPRLLAGEMKPDQLVVTLNPQGKIVGGQSILFWVIASKTEEPVKLKIRRWSDGRPSEPPVQG